MDAKDFRLLVELYEDSRQSYQSLGRRISLTAPAVRERLKKLQDRGILQGYMVSVDPSLFDRVEQSVFYHKHAWTRDEAIKALAVPDVAWAALKMDGGLTVQVWPYGPSEAVKKLTEVLGGEPSGQTISEPTPHHPLSLLDWEIVEALIDDPRAPLKALTEVTRISPKTLRKHLESLIREEKLFISPRLGPLADPGEIIFTIAVFGKVSATELRKLLGDAFLIKQTHQPPVKYLLCRSNGLADVTTKTQLVKKLQRVESVEVTLTREFLVSTDFMHTLVSGKIHELKETK